MIVTVTPNPSLDKTADLPGPLVRGQVLRMSSQTVVAAGKGVNISRALCHAAAPTLALVPSSPHDPLVAGLARDGIPHRAVPIAAPVRSNLTVTEPDGTTTKLNSPGAHLSTEELEAFRRAVLGAAGDADWVVMTGSVPPGIPADWYARMVPLVRERGARVAVDTSDDPLKALSERLPECAPDLVKPNSVELGQLCGADGEALEEAAMAGHYEPVVEAARRLAGIPQVLVTLGGSGALLVTADQAWHAVARPVEVRSTVGAGDSSLAGFLLALSRGDNPAQCLRTAVSWGTAAAALPGSTIPTVDQAAAVEVRVEEV